MTFALLVSTFVAVAVVLLRVIAPKTKTTLDDTALALLEKLEPHLTEAELGAVKAKFLGK